MDFEGLLWCVEEAGCTAVFEWIGRSVRMKVKEREGKVVLLQVRNKVTGEYVPQEEVARWAEMFGVESVVRRTDLEGKTFKEVFGEVKGEGVDEGVVVRLNTGSIVKVKTGWWLAAKHHEYRRWRSGEHWEAERKRRQKKEDKMEVQEMRAVGCHQGHCWS